MLTNFIIHLFDNASTRFDSILYCLSCLFVNYSNVLWTTYHNEDAALSDVDEDC